ncbi:uncharacterized protein I206_106197 [Kwoniella pini CBS 10737]|uniref:Uncharacterized protein n=1 Tax=Kwoniella pini CBS 10737 TaxID=1296096 RepID=A0A1B9I1K2_9TREE|nr:uncharacterized protein I206_05022 [Kwoniella pini CBS 10737]OCF49331.1 hypothetical protein I206_05022 [Kwoniella pini CBS 10737]
MLISPSKIHSNLISLLSTNYKKGPHTALLIYPNGQLVSSANLPSDDYEDDDEDNQSNGKLKGQEELEEEEEEEEPYLEIQERFRLLLGLASQWDRQDSGKMECELGKLHFKFIQLPISPLVSSIGKESLPSVKNQFIDGFILILNSTKNVEWKILLNKSEEFKKNWDS